MKPPEQVIERLEREANIWVATVRPDQRPHLTPVWFAWSEERLYICIPPGSVKARNLTHNQKIALSLENGSQPVIVEGTAAPVPPPWPEAVIAIFEKKYGWNIATDPDYGLLLAVTPHKWLAW